jgi:transcriptional regulator GlxA family with amidase domain
MQCRSKNQTLSLGLLAERGSQNNLCPLNGVVSHAGVARCLRFIGANFWRPIQVADLQRVAVLSRRGLQKAFLKHTGRGPGQILRLYRIQQACQILAEKDVALPQLASMCGFRKVNSLFVAFRNVVGVSPRQFHQHARSISNIRPLRTEIHEQR